MACKKPGALPVAVALAAPRDSGEWTMERGEAVSRSGGRRRRLGQRARASQAAAEHGRRRQPRSTGADGVGHGQCRVTRVECQRGRTTRCRVGGGGRESRDLTDEVQGDLTGRGPAAASRARSKASWRVGRRRRLACWRCEEWRCQHATDVGRRRRLAPTQASRRHGSDAGAGESPRAG